MQLPLFKPESDWKPPSLNDLPSWAAAKRVAVDTETHDPHLKSLGPSVRRGGFIAGVSFAIEDGPCFYLPIRHEGGGNLPESAVLQYLRDQAKAFTGDLVGANLSYDLDYLAEDGIEFNPRYFRDVQIADPLIYALHQSYRLDEIATRWRLPGKDEAALVQAAKIYGVDPKGGLWKLPAEFVGAYAEQDARLPLQIIRRQESKIDDLDLWDVYNLESRVLPILVKLRRRGIRVDMERLEEIENWSIDEEAKAFRLIRKETGVKVEVGDVWTAQALVPALESVGISIGQTDTGKPSITKELLANANHPVADAILWARKVNKLRTTFAASIREHEVNGRIHCTINQIARESETGGILGARFGRMSCTQPNLQQQPARDEFGSRWRSIYVPEEGKIWACNDYSQQEPRWTTHYAHLLQLQGAAGAVDRYRNDPRMDNHAFMAEITGLPRGHAKQIYLGLCYGEGGGKLCDQLGLPTRWACSVGKGGSRRVTYHESYDEALQSGLGLNNRRIYRTAGDEGQAILDQFDRRAPYIRLLANAVKDKVETHGTIRTADGRLIHFPQNQDGTFDWSYKGLNRLIQGSAAGQIKKAMVDLDRELPEFWMQLPVHDEVNASVNEPEVAHMAARIMEETMEASVPFVVKPKLGGSWGEVA